MSSSSLPMLSAKRSGLTGGLFAGLDQLLAAFEQFITLIPQAVDSVVELTHDPPAR